MPDHETLRVIKAVLDDGDRAAGHDCAMRLYDAGCYWEAHEIWEPVWMSSAPGGAERHLLAGLIQLANALLKLVMGQQKAVLRLLDDASAKLGEALIAGAVKGAGCVSLDLAALLGRVASFRERIASCSGDDLATLEAMRPRLGDDAPERVMS